MPTYNEADNIERLIENIFELYPNLNIIIVDDNSPDGTGDIVDRLSKKNSSIDVIHRTHKMGLGRAYIHGFKEALSMGADLIFEMDADFSHNPKYIPLFLNAAKKSDLVIGSRYVGGIRVEGWRFRRLLLSKLANIFVSYIMVKPIWDFTSGFRCYSRKILETIELDKLVSDGYAFQIEMVYLAYKHGFRVTEIPIIFKEREGGYSKISRKVVIEAFWISLKCRAPLKDIVRHLPFIFKDYSKFAKDKKLFLDE